ncbi:MAG TPA: class I SAM-dependent methyltransferase [Gemmatimonadaceae bacterium]|nr:class I SAM-dependent methyltransferase [Gemmatimonadaceae bacterium]
MSVFGAYARYYDLLYGDKDYSGEASYVASLLSAHSPDARSILEIGCGTGAHAAELARLGYSVTGIDLSDGMLQLAEERKNRLSSDLTSNLSFIHGDARNARLHRKFDAVISLFHVMSYQATSEDLAAAFATSRAHLADGGAFVFDCWYGPAVLTQKPAVAVKHLADARTKITRIAEPAIRLNDNVVDVSYTVLVTDVESSTTETLRETHSMRYLFTPEVKTALALAGMDLVASHAWMSAEQPSAQSWSACYVGTG